MAWCCIGRIVRLGRVYIAQDSSFGGQSCVGGKIHIDFELLSKY